MMIRTAQKRAAIAAAAVIVTFGGAEAQTAVPEAPPHSRIE